MSSTPTPLSPLTTLSSSLDSLAIYHAVRDNTGQIVDFRLAMVNDSPLHLWMIPQTNPIGERISQLAEQQDAPYLIRQLSLVVDSGRAVRFDMDCHWQHDGSGHRCEVMASKLEDGVQISSGPIADPVAGIDSENKPHDRFIESILNTVTYGVMVGSAVRGANGQINDILITDVNDQAAAMAGHTVNDMVGQLNSQLFPGIFGMSVFDFYVHTIESGEAQTHELQYNRDGLDTWANLKTTKLGDGLVITWTDMSEHRRVRLLQHQQQAALLESIQSTSQGGITAYESIRNEAGRTVDFQPVFRNAVATHIVNLTSDQATSQTVTEVLSRSVQRSTDVFLSLADQYALVRQTPFFNRYIAVAETGVGDQFEQSFFVDGVERVIDVVVTRWQDGILTNKLEVTELRRAEREKIKQANLNRTVLDAVQTAVSAYDAVRDERGQIVDFRFTLANSNLLKQARRSEAEVVGSLLTETFPGTIPTGLLTRYIAVVETGQSQQYELHYNHDGLDTWVLGAISPSGDGVVASSIDITQQKRAEWQAQQQAGLNRTVLDTAQTSIAAVEAVRNDAGKLVDFRYILVNQLLLKETGLAEADLIGRLMTDVFPGSIESGVLGQYSAVVETRQPCHYEIHYPYDGLDIWALGSVTPYGDGVVISSVDITRQKQAELQVRQQKQQLEKANHELKRSNESLQSFAFIASHDLQEPLRKITSFADILHTQYAGQFNVGATDVIRRINDSAKRVRLLIHDLLDYSRIETRQESSKPVNLTALLDVLRENELWAAFHQSKAVIEHLNLPVPLADPLQMRQLFQNLLSNAIKFCPNDTVPIIKVSSRVIDRADVPAGLLSPTKVGDSKPAGRTYYEIAITDNGIGFDEKHAERIFQVFQRLHGRNQYPGSGIGLAICQKIVERHNGAISASSEPGKGSTFTVYLPK